MWYSLVKQSDGGYRDYLPTVNLKTPEVSEDMINKMYETHKRGLSIDEVARQFGYDHNLLRKRFKQKGYETNKNISPSNAYIQLAQKMLTNKPLCETIIKRFEEGRSPQSISVDKDIKLPAITVSEIIKTLKGINKISLTPTPEDISFAVSLFRLGKNPQFIARRTGISPQAIMKYIMTKLSPEEKEAYRQKIKDKNGPEFVQKIDKIIQFIKEKPKMKLVDLAKVLNVNIGTLKHTIDIFLDES